MSDPSKPKAKTDTMTAFRSAMQIIYEQLMLAFADAMETLRELQVQDKHAERRAEESEVTIVALEESEPRVELAAMHEVERTIAAMVDARELPTQRELQRLQRDLEALNAALDERLAAHEHA